MSSFLSLFIDPEGGLIFTDFDMVDMVFDSVFLESIARYLFIDGEIAAYKYVKKRFPGMVDSMPACMNAVKAHQYNPLFSSTSVLNHPHMIYNTERLFWHRNMFVQDYTVRGYLDLLNHSNHAKAIQCVVYVFLNNLCMQSFVRNYNFVKQEANDIAIAIRQLLLYMKMHSSRLCIGDSSKFVPAGWLSYEDYLLFYSPYRYVDIGGIQNIVETEEEGVLMRHILVNERCIRPSVKDFLDFINATGEVYPHIYADIYAAGYGYWIDSIPERSLTRDFSLHGSDVGSQIVAAIWRCQLEKKIAVIMPTPRKINRLLGADRVYIEKNYQLMRKAYMAFMNADLRKRTKTINFAIQYAKSLIHKPYIYYRPDDQILHLEDRFYATSNSKLTSEQVKAVNCAGLINLVRRYIGLSVPGVKRHHKWSGTTGFWFAYLTRTKRLEKLDVKKIYPVGTLLIRDYSSESDQGHLAIICSSSKRNVLWQSIIHAYPVKDYVDSMPDEIVGEVNITRFGVSHYFFDKHNGFYTHVCLPENWLMKE